MFLDAMNVSSLTIALPAIQSDLGLDTNIAQWVLSGYTVAFGGLLLLGGRVTDVLGRRRTLVAGLALLAVGSIGAGMSSGAVTLIVFRVVAGAGAALVAPASLSSLVTYFSSPRARARAIAAYSVTGAMGFGIGLALSGVLTNIDWRLTLLVPGALALLAGGLTAFVVPADAPYRDRIRRRFDIWGATTATAGLLLLVFAVTSFATAGTGILALATGVVGAALLVLFVSIERRGADPLLPLPLLRVGIVGTANVLAAFWAAASIGWQFVASLYLGSELGFSPLHAGLALLPLAVAIVVTQTVAVRLIAARGPALTGVLGMTLQALGIAWFLVAIATGSYLVGILPGLLLHGIGNGLAFPTFFTGATQDVPDDRQGIASALVNTSVQVGSGLGVAILAAILTSTASIGVRGFVTAIVVATLFSLAGATTVLVGLRRRHNLTRPAAGVASERN
ncbi:MFS transporter [Promicromonospora sp. NPDC090134]|uniref:MFS transporter n=1 Tax=Promicromonospora sp. NPDC090134 TaxID=3364408 RepID=UPI003820E563